MKVLSYWVDTYKPLLSCEPSPLIYTLYFQSYIISALFFYPVNLADSEHTTLNVDTSDFNEENS